MLKRKNEIDVKLLRFAIEKTVGFETIVERRFHGNTLDHANNPITSHLNEKFKSSLPGKIYFNSNFKLIFFLK